MEKCTTSAPLSCNGISQVGENSLLPTFCHICHLVDIGAVTLLLRWVSSLLSVKVDLKVLYFRLLSGNSTSALSAFLGLLALLDWMHQLILGKKCTLFGIEDIFGTFSFQMQFE